MWIWDNENEARHEERRLMESLNAYGTHTHETVDFCRQSKINVDVLAFTQLAES